MDALAALRLQIEWGVDEALEDAPVDRTRADAPKPAPAESRDAPPARPAAPAPRPGLTARAAMIAQAAPTLEALRDALAAFTDCPLAVTATRLVFADGNPQAGLVLVGDVPGPEEDRSGTPMAGPAGEFLDRMLASIGLDRSRLLITLAIPWRPPGGRAPAESEIAMCVPFLLRHLALLRPRIVVSLGALPTRALTGQDATIRKLRGKWQTIELPGEAEGAPTQVKLLPMLHPSAIARSPKDKKDAWADLLALQRTLNSA
jgi:DNA polymerase